jgi:hypothetical protein
MRGLPAQRVTYLHKCAHINEDETGNYTHVKAEHQAEWPPEFLQRPKRAQTTIVDFMAADPTSNRLDALRGLANVLTMPKW